MVLVIIGSWSALTVVIVVGFVHKRTALKWRTLAMSGTDARFITDRSFS
jgi:alpha-galactosidase/6-phospho-beta-glucosidase family protein